MMEWVKYSSYGVPIRLPADDTDNGGVMAIVIKVISILLTAGSVVMSFVSTLKLVAATNNHACDKRKDRQDRLKGVGDKKVR